MRFVPDDKSCLESLYKAMSECQLLHPDPNDSISEEDEEEEEEAYDSAGGDGMFEDVEANQEGSGNQIEVAYHVAAAEQLLGVPQANQHENGDVKTDEPMEVAGQFDDAEPDQ